MKGRRRGTLASVRSQSQFFYRLVVSRRRFITIEDIGLKNRNFRRCCYVLRTSQKPSPITSLSMQLTLTSCGFDTFQLEGVGKGAGLAWEGLIVLSADHSTAFAAASAHVFASGNAPVPNNLCQQAI